MNELKQQTYLHLKHFIIGSYLRFGQLKSFCGLNTRTLNTRCHENLQNHDLWNYPLTKNTIYQITFFTKNLIRRMTCFLSNV